MSERTALQLAEMLRQQHAEIERLSAINSALTAKVNMLVIAAEREACVRICETALSLEEAACLIRARSAS